MNISESIRREKISRSMRDQWANGTRNGDAVREAWKNPLYRDKCASALNGGLKAFWKDPEKRKQKAEVVSRQMKKQWQDPEYRAKRSKNHSIAMKAHWASLGSKERKEHTKNFYPKSFTLTAIEKAVADELDKRQIDYKQQKWIHSNGERFCVDFFVHSLGLVIECDGEYWHSLPNVVDRDRKKEVAVLSQGFDLIRLPGTVILKDVAGVLDSALVSYGHAIDRG